MNKNHIFITEYDQGEPGAVRVAIKDNIDVEGVPTTAGTRARSDASPAAEDSPVVARIRQAGGHIVGKTNLDELANGATGINPWFGAVPNPTDSVRISGGSSSGSAAAVGLDLADMALGTDTGGSLRIPAALCGVAGFKPTKGYFSTHGVYPTADRMDVIGPMAKDLAGLRRAFELMAPNTAGAEASRVRKVARIRFEEPETEVDTAIDAALQRAGVEIHDLTIPDWGLAHAASYTIISRQCWSVNEGLLAQHPDDIGEVARAVILDGAEVDPREYGAAFAFGNEWARRIDALFSDYDLLVCPAVTQLAPTPEQMEQVEWGTFTRTMQFNLSGHPALSAPIDVPGTHLKAGMQIVGPYGTDANLLAAAENLFA